MTGAARGRAAWGLCAAALVLVLAGCSENTASAAAGDSSTAATNVAPVELTSNAKGKLAASKDLTVTASGGTIQSVEVTMVTSRTVGVTSGGVVTLSGTLNQDSTTWTSDQDRAPGQKYKLVATGVNSAGETETLTRTFSTPDPSTAFTVDVTPWGNDTVGVAQPVVVTTSKAVTSDAARKRVENALVVRTSEDVGAAAWYWVSDKEIHFRPKTYWPSGTKVSVEVQLAGVKINKSTWGTADRTVKFKIGRSFIMKISDKTHTMTVYKNGKKVKSIPVSMGASGNETRSGIKTIMTQQKKVRMTSDSYGGADYYDEIVYYAQRLTWSGEFIHSAPWSVASQGVTNVSHGCVNVSQANAIWLFKQTLIGDPVVTTGTGREMETSPPWNGWGATWNLSWSDYLEGSATGEVDTSI